MENFDLFKWRRLQSVNEGSNANRWFDNLKFYYEKGLKSPDLKDPAEKKAYIKLAKQFFRSLKEGIINEGLNPKKAAKVIFDKLVFAKLIGNQNRKRAEGIIEFQLRAINFGESVNEGLVNEALDINDPVLVAIRAWKTQIKKKTPAKKIKKISFDQYYKLMDVQEDLIDSMKDTAEDLEQLFRDMEQEAEPSGGPIADKYGAQLDKLEKKYANLKKKKAVVDKKIENYRIS